MSMSSCRSTITWQKQLSSKTTMSSIGLALGGTHDVFNIGNDKKDNLIQSLQQELGMLKEEIEEFNNLQMLVTKTTRKNGVIKLIEKYLMTRNKLNANKIAYLLRESL